MKWDAAPAAGILGLQRLAALLQLPAEPDSRHSQAEPGNEKSLGTRNTLMIGERPPSTDFWYGWWYATGSGSQSTGDVALGVAELNPAHTPDGDGMGRYLDDCPPGPYRFTAGRNEQCNTLHFWSYHSGGANFAYADGSVRLIPYAIEETVMRALATRAGGEVVNLDY